MLNKDLILKAVDLKTEVIEVPEWGDSLTITELSGADLERWQSKAQKANADSAATLGELVALSVINQDGSRMFGDKDIKALLTKSHKPLMRIYNAAIKVNMLGEDGAAELEKN